MSRCDRGAKAGLASTEPASNDTKPFVKRLGASAATLTRQALLRPSGAAIAQTMGSLSMNTEKGESSSSLAASEESCSDAGTLSSGPSSMASDTKEMATGSSIDPFQGPVNTSGSILTDSAPFTLDAFLSGRDLPMFGVSSSTSCNDGPTASKPKECRETIWKDIPEHSNSQHGFDSDYMLTREEEIRSFTSSSNIGSAGCELDSKIRNLIDPNDGAAVVDLLSKPNFLMDDDHDDHIPNSIENSYICREAKCPGTGQSKVCPGREDNALARQLIPDFGITDTQLRKLAHAMPHAVDEAHNAELQPWLEILDSYQDEVWGDILPLVRQARDELVKSKKCGNDSSDRPAVRRLRMLLSHLAPP